MTLGELAAFGAAISWTFSAMFYRKALQETKPVVANIIRLTCTGGILFLIVIAIGKISVLASLPAEALMLAGFSGIIGLGFGDTLYMVSLKRIGVVRAVPITCIYPLFTLLWAIILAGEEVTVSICLGAIAVVLGTWLLSRETENEASPLEKRNLLIGVTYALATAAIWSISITMMDLAVTLPEKSGIDNALAVNTIRVMTIAVSLLALSPVLDRERSFLKVRKRTIATLVAGGVVALGLGWFFLSYSFTEIPESRAVPISSTTPLFSALVGMVFLHEKVTKRDALGSIVIVAGIFFLFLV